MDKLNVITPSDGLLRIGKEADNIELIDFPGARIIGKKRRIPHSKNFFEACGPFWDDFIARWRTPLEHLPTLIPGFNVSVRFDFGTGGYQYLAGVITPRGTKVPKGYNFFDIPPCRAVRCKKYTQALQEEAVKYGYSRWTGDFIITLSACDEDDARMYMYGDILCRVRNCTFDMRLHELDRENDKVGREYAKVGNKKMIDRLVDEYRRQELSPAEKRFFRQLDKCRTKYNRTEMFMSYKSVYIKFSKPNAQSALGAESHQIHFNLGTSITVYQITKRADTKPYDICFFSSTFKDGTDEADSFYSVMSTKYEEFLLNLIFEVAK